MKEFRRYKNKTYYYVGYASEGLVRFNPEYKVGLTIALLKLRDDDMFITTEIIDSVNKNVYGPDKAFFPSLYTHVVGWDKRDVIEQVFSKEWYKP